MVRLSEQFIDREGLLKRLAGLLDPRSPGLSTVTLHGLAGVGKTFVARVFCERYGDKYSGVHWVRASRIMDGYREIVTRLDPMAGQAIGEMTDQEVLGAVLGLLETERGWLLVLDDAESSEAVGGYLPAVGGSVLITSRDAGWAGLGVALEVEPFGREDAVSFLIDRVGAVHATDAAADIAERLGGLPVALEEAVRSIHRGGLTLDRYAGLLNADLERVLALRGPRGRGHRVASIWLSSLASIRRTVPAAHGLLSLLSFVAPEGLDQAYLWEAEELRVPARPDGGHDGAELVNDLLAALRRHSLVHTRSAEDAARSDTVSVHRLVQAVVRERMAARERRAWSGAALRLIARAFPREVERCGEWQVCDGLVAHALAVTGYARTMGVEVETACQLLGRVGWYEWQVGRVDTAERHLREAVELAEREDLGTPVRIWLDNRLGLLLARTRRPELAAVVLEATRALEVDRASDATERRFTLNALGLVYQAQGREDDARRAFEESAGLLDAALDAQAPALPMYRQGRTAYQETDVTVTSLLGRARQAQAEGPEEESLPGFLEALAIARRLWGPGHPELALCLEYLGRALERTDRTQERKRGDRALRFLERARGIDERWFGRRHPRVASDLDAIGLALRHEDNRQARELLSRAIAINQERLGADHPSVGHNLMHLAEVLIPGRDLGGAMVMYSQALRVYRANPGASQAHHWVAHARKLLEQLEEIRDLFG